MRPRTTAARVRQAGTRQLGSGTRQPSEAQLGRLVGEIGGEDEMPGASRTAVPALRTPQKALRAMERRSGPSAAVLEAMSERDFQRHVRTSLEQRGYVVMVIPDMRRVRAGWPDLTIWHPQRPGWLGVWELKASRTPVTRLQAEVIAILASVPGIDARVVRPSDWLILKEEV